MAQAKTYEEIIAESQKEILEGLCKMPAPALLKLGIEAFDEEDYHSALFVFNKATKLYPQSEEAWLYKGIALGRLTRFQEAVVALKKALEINPNFKEAGGALTFLKSYLMSAE